MELFHIRILVNGGGPTGVGVSTGATALIDHAEITVNETGGENSPLVKELPDPSRR